MGLYSSLEDHHSMVFDETRNTAYGRAIAAAVNNKSVVLDLGAGLGLHGLMAARAGARKVYLVEPEPILEITRRVVEDNGFDNVELIAASAETLELPELVDVIISVFTGNFLLTEDLLPSLFLARDNFLKPGGRMIPERAQMRVAPVSAAAYHQKHIGCWSPLAEPPDSGGVAAIDYRAARRYAANTAYYDGPRQFQSELLAPAINVMELDFLSAQRAECDHSCESVATQAGLCHGWQGWFRMWLGEEWLSTSPGAEPMHWSQVLLPLDPPLALAAGETINLHLQRPQRGDWSWSTSTGQEQQRRSTFLSSPPPLARLHKLAEHYQPNASAAGRAAGFVLSRFDGRETAATIAAQLQAREPAQFKSSAEALEFVRNLVEKYG